MAYYIPSSLTCRASYLRRRKDCREKEEHTEAGNACRYEKVTEEIFSRAAASLCCSTISRKASVRSTDVMEVGIYI